MEIADSAGGLSVAEQAALWRRQFSVFDTIAYGYIAAEFQRLRGADPGPAAVTLTDLVSARHTLSVPRFYPGRCLVADHFRASDPSSDHYAGRLEADLLRVRNETDAEFA